MSKIVKNYVEFPVAIKRPLWQFWHNVMIKFDKEKTATFLNYGYQGLNGDPKLELKKEDESDRYCIQLYDHVVNKADLKGKDVIEVGSGRGGGASYISRYFKPLKYTALDISAGVIKFCNDYHKVDGLSFVKGFAENLPFANSSADFLVNVESARCYSSLDKFFSEVHRVLRPEGEFLFADMIKDGEVAEVEEKLTRNGFEIKTKRDISKNVVESLDNDTHRRKSLIDGLVPKFLNKHFQQFAGTKNTERYNSFANGSMQYWSYILKRKQNGVN